MTHEVGSQLLSSPLDAFGVGLITTRPLAFEVDHQFDKVRLEVWMLLTYEPERRISLEGTLGL